MAERGWRGGGGPDFEFKYGLSGFKAGNLSVRTLPPLSWRLATRRTPLASVKIWEFQLKILIEKRQQQSSVLCSCVLTIH